MMLLVSFLLIVLSNVCLCLAYNKHYKKLTKHALIARLKFKLRVVGHTTLFASLVLAFVSDSYVGLVYWCGLFSLVAVPMPFIVA